MKKLTVFEKARNRFDRRVTHPDNVCEAEYRAVYDLLNDALIGSGYTKDSDPTEDLRGICDQFISSAREIKKALRRRKH